MPYRIDPTEPTDVELRRVLAEQLERAASALRTPGGPDAEAVHDVRKRLKKARSALRLGRADLGPAVVRHANDELRRVGAELAPQRDADALVEALDRLTSAVADPDGTDGTDGVALDPATEDALGAVRELLVARASEVRERGGLTRPVVLGAARTLEQTSSWLLLVPAHATGWDGLGPGFTRQYRRGRHALAGLPTEPSVDELHEWRKRVKDLWYHQRLLRRLWTDAQRPVVEAADEAASALGEDHDLGLLQAHLAPAGDHDAALLRAGAADVDPLPVDDHVRGAVGALAADRRAALQARARRLGAVLYADRPTAWGDRHGAWWAAAAAAGAPPATDDRTREPDPPTVAADGADPSPDGANA